MKANRILRMAFCGMILMLFALSACTDTPDEYADVPALEREIERLEREVQELKETISRLESAADTPDDGSREHIYVLGDCDGNCVELELPELWVEISGENTFTLAYTPEQNSSAVQIRVFENGNANVRLFPDGTFIANLFHNTKITGTYTEMTDGREIAVLFTYSGITVVGGIVNGVLTIPEDWDDGHGHGMDFVYRAYPMVFLGENGQKIILYADNTFEANFTGEVRIIGFYGIRAASVTFVPGSPTFDRNGVPVGTFLLAELRTCGGDDIDNAGQGSDDDCDIDTVQNPTPDPTPTPASSPTPNPSPSPSPNPSPNPTPDPTPTPTPDPTPSPGHGDGDNNGDPYWCEDCDEWH